MTEPILHILPCLSWHAAQAQGVYTAGEALEKGQFIHCSTPAQTSRVANTLFHGQRGLVLLVIDPSRLTSELRWEPGVDLNSEFFPHIYGPLNLGAVMEVLEFEPRADGGFDLPASLSNDN